MATTPFLSEFAFLKQLQEDLYIQMANNKKADAVWVAKQCAATPATAMSIKVGILKRNRT